MNEQQIRAIVKDEMQKNYRSGSPDVAPHSHNGTDGLQVYLGDVLGSVTLPSSNSGIMSPINIQERIIVSTPPGQVGTVPAVPFLVLSGDLGAEVLSFAGGDAYSGTGIIYHAGSSRQFWVKNPFGGWDGIDFTLTA